jgi:hypothetical protein
MLTRFTITIMALCLVYGASPALAQCPDWLAGPLDNGSAANGANGNIYASISWDPDGGGPLGARLVVAGSFTSIGGVSVVNIAQRDPITGLWSPIGGGIPATVNALAVFNDQLVAGTVGDNDVGTFDQTVKVWDGSSWTALGATNTGSVFALAVYNGALYIGGTFLTNFTSGVDPAYFVARWNPGADAWDNLSNPFGSQTNTGVYALAEYNGDLYAGGFAHGTTSSVVDLAYYNGSGWTHVTTGADLGGIYALGVFSGELIVGGGFNTINGLTVSNICGWNGSSFHAFSSGTAGTPYGGAVYSITVYQGITIGGQFDHASGVPASHVALWPAGGSAWQALGGGPDDAVRSMLFYNNQLVAAGQFLNADVPASHIAHWDGTQWGSFGGGTGSYVLAMADYHGRVVAGGSFSQSTGSLSTARNVAGWSGGTAQAFGVGTDGAVWALKSFKYSGLQGNYELIAGGTFSQAGGISASNIARWDESPYIYLPPAWAAMGPGFNNGVFAVERFNNSTYAGGTFTASGVTSTAYIALWNESSKTWGPVGLGMNGTVYALAAYNGYLYAGGNFTTAGSVTTGGLARWDGSSWSQCGGYFNGIVLSLGIYNGQLVIGGQYPGINSSPNLASYDGTYYYTFGTGGTNNSVRAIVGAGSRLYVAGQFTSIGGVPVNHIGYWDGSWHDLPNGTDGNVYALAAYASEIEVGGFFGEDNYGGTPITSPFWGRYSATGSPWFAANPSSVTIPFGGNASFTAQPAAGLTGLSYQWLLDNAPLSDGLTASGATISGATTETLNVAQAGWPEAANYRLVITNGCGSDTTYAASLSFTGVTAAPGPGTLVTVLRSLGPNPANGATRLAYSLARDGDVRFTVHDLRGRLVRRLEAGEQSAGLHETQWDARDDQGRRVATGMYLVRFMVDGRPVNSRRLTIVR